MLAQPDSREQPAPLVRLAHKVWLEYPHLFKPPRG